MYEENYEERKLIKKQQKAKLITGIIFLALAIIMLVLCLTPASSKINPTNDNTTLETATIKSVENLYEYDEVYILHLQDSNRKMISVARGEIVDLESFFNLASGDSISFRLYESSNYTLTLYSTEIQVAQLESNGVELVTFDSYKQFMLSWFNDFWIGPLIFAIIFFILSLVLLFSYNKTKNKILSEEFNK